LRVTYGIAPLHEALWIRVAGERLVRPDAGVGAALALSITPAFAPKLLLHDHPYGIGPVSAEHDRVRKYPTGDWMTSPQVFEEVRRPFTSSSLVDLCVNDAAGPGLLIVHDGSQSWQREERGVRCVLSLYDPWDEDYFDDAFEAELFLIPHGRMSLTARARTAQELNLGAPRFSDHAPVRGGGDLPPTFGALSVDAPNVLATSFQRVGARDAEHLPRHFAAVAEAREPFVLRLVEFDGREAEVLVRVPGGVGARGAHQPARRGDRGPGADARRCAARTARHPLERSAVADAPARDRHAHARPRARSPGAARPRPASPRLGARASPREAVSGFIEHIPGIKPPAAATPAEKQIGIGVLGLHEGRTLLVGLERAAHARAVAGCDRDPIKLEAARAARPDLTYVAEYEQLLALPAWTWSRSTRPIRCTESTSSRPSTPART
jgi:hypothetical protein